MCPKRVDAVGFFKSLLDKDFKNSLSTAWESAALRGARAESRSWDGSPPSCGLLLVSAELPERACKR
eukprot:5023493-Pyramimonas_sp.AAC.2